MARTKVYRAKRLGGLTTALTITLVLVMLGGVASAGVYLNMLAGTLGLATVAIGPGTGDTTTILDLAYVIGACGYFIAGGLAAILALTFTYRSTANAHAFARGVGSSPSMALWWWIIPFLSLFKPYGVMSEAWRVGRDPDRWRSLKDPASLRWWWATYLVGAILGTFGSLTESSISSVQTTVTSYTIIVIGLVSQLISTVLYLVIIRAVARGHDTLIAAGYVKPAPTTPSWSA